MKTLSPLRFAVIALLWMCPFFGQAQDANNLARYIGSKVVITTVDGLEFRGTVNRVEDTTLVMATSFGQVVFYESHIDNIEMDSYTGEFRFPNPHETRYFFGPSAIPLKRGKGYYQNIMVVGNFVNVGITDWFSLGGGFEFISTVSGEPIGFLTPKFGWQLSENWHAGGGLFLGGMVNEFSFALPYAAITYGSPESNLTLGGGMMRADGEWQKGGAIMFSGTHRVSNSIALLTENYILPGAVDVHYFGIHGIRILSEKNAFDIGVIAIPGFTDGIPIPYVGYARGF